MNWDVKLRSSPSRAVCQTKKVRHGDRVVYKCGKVGLRIQSLKPCTLAAMGLAFMV